MHAPNTYALVADIGGTNTRVALAEGSRILPQTVRRYANADHPGLQAVLERYIADEGGVDTAAACVAVAGPVRGGAATMTNLDWTIDVATVARATRAETVAILNDLQAQGHALGHVPQDKLRTVLPGPDAAADASKLVIGIGTGFNAAPVLEGAAGRIVPASECGHANFPVQTAQDWEMAQYLRKEHGFAATEEVLSGRGLSQVYAFLSHQAGDDRRARSSEVLAAYADCSDPRAREAIDIFVRTLGAVAGNLCLIQLPFGGVYLVGGMARAFAPYLDQHGFAAAFRDKGRFSPFMDSFAVHVVEDDYAALAGCAAYLVGIGSRAGANAADPAPSL